MMITHGSSTYNTFTKLHIEKSEKFSAFCPPSATSTLKQVAASKSGTHSSLSPPPLTRNARSKATGNDPFCTHDKALHTYCSRSWAVADVRAVEVTVVPSCRASRKLWDMPILRVSSSTQSVDADTMGTLWGSNSQSHRRRRTGPLAHSIDMAMLSFSFHRNRCPLMQSSTLPRYTKLKSVVLSVAGQV